MLVLVHYVLFTAWACPGVLYVVLADRKKMKWRYFFPPGSPLLVVANIFASQVFLFLSIFLYVHFDSYSNLIPGIS